MKLSDSKPFAVTRELVDKLITEQEKEFSRALEHDHGEGEDHPNIIEKKIIKAKLNGYEIADIFLKKTQSFEASLFLSASPLSVLQRIRDVIHPTFSFRKIHFHTFPLAFFSAVRDIYHSTSDFILIDVGGEITDVSIVQKNVLTEHASFPLGKHFLLRKIAAALGLSAHVAASFLKMYTDDRAGGELRNDLLAIVNQTKLDWRSVFRDVLEEIGSETLLPLQTFVTADFEAGPVFASWIHDEKTDSLGIAAENLKVQFIDDHTVSEFIEWDRLAKHDAFLALETLFLNKIFNLEK